MTKYIVFKKNTVSKLLKISALWWLLCALAIFGTRAKGYTVPDGETYIDWDYMVICEEVGNIYSICPELLMAIIERESGGRANVGDGDCTGLMGISKHWNKDRMKRLGVVDLKDPYSNILVGADILVELITTECDGDVGCALMRYHGESDWRKKYEAGELSNYAADILKRSEALERIHLK